MGLVDEHPRVGQDVTLARSAGRQQHGGGRAGLPDAHGRDVGDEELHRVVDGEQAGHVAAGGVDVQEDVAARSLGVEVEELGDDEVRRCLVDLRTEEHDARAEQSRVQVDEPLALRRLLGDGGDDEGHPAS